MAESPTSLEVCEANSLLCSVQRASSPLSAPSRALAASIFLWYEVASSVSLCLLAMASSKVFCMASNFSWTTLAFSSATAFSLLAILSSASALLSASIFGVTTLAT